MSIEDLTTYTEVDLSEDIRVPTMAPMLRATWSKLLQEEIMKIQREWTLPKLMAEDIISVQPMTMPILKKVCPTLITEELCDMKFFKAEEFNWNKGYKPYIPLVVHDYPEPNYNVPRTMDLKIVKTRLEARRRKIKPGWKIEWEDNGDFSMWYEEPEEKWLEDEDFLV